MSLPRRFSSRVGIYYLVFKGQTEEPVFTSDTSCRDFIDILSAVLADTGYRLYAFCLLPGEVHLAVTMAEIPLADFEQRLILKFNQRTRQRKNRTGLLSGSPAEPRFFDEEEQLRELIRFIHLLPLKAQQDPRDYSWSGHKTYLGKARISGVETRRGLHLFGADCKQARETYEAHFLSGLKAVRERRPLTSDRQGCFSMCVSLEQLTGKIAELAGKSVHGVRSNSRERNFSLLRAVLTWHASRLEVATMSEISRYLNRDPSTLYVSIKRYAILYPRLFEKPGDFESLTSMATVRVNGRIAADSASSGTWVMSRPQVKEFPQHLD